jgi:hypothetical protein
MIHLIAEVDDTAELLAAEAYGPGALFRWESSDAYEGPYVEGSTTALRAGVSDYDFWDDAGLEGRTWYRTRISDAAGTTFDVYSAPFQASAASFVRLSQVRALVRSRLDDSDLQDVIDREESWLATKIGALAGERTDTFHPGTTNTPIYLPRRAESVVVTDAGIPVAAADLVFTPSTGCIRRAVIDNPWPTNGPVPFGYSEPGVEPYYPRWNGAVAVTWTPSDGAAVTRAIIELVRGTVGETGMESETIGDYQYTRGARAGALSRPALVRSILLRRPAYSMPLRTVGEPA